MSKLIDLQSQIEKLQKEASEIRSKEFNATVADIRQLMAAYGITPKDLQNPKVKAKSSGINKPLSSKPGKAKKEKVSVAAKFKGPNGETWSGRGLTPKWLAALISTGQPKEAFLISSTLPN